MSEAERIWFIIDENGETRRRLRARPLRPHRDGYSQQA
jgi:hypothetical protein